MLELVKYNKKEHFQIWQNFVEENGHLFHDIRWLEIISSSYSLEPFYYLVYNSNELIGLAPFFKIKKNIILSLPFISFAGFCLKKEQFEKNQQSIIENILFQNIDGINEINIRQMKEEFPEIPDSTPKKYVTMIKKLEEDVDSTFKSFDKKQRNMIRKAEQEPFELHDTELDTFYRIYLRATNELGTPGHKKLFFNNIIQAFGESVRLKLLKREKMEVGVLFEIDYFRTRYDLWAFSLKEFFQFKPNVYLYWETLKDAISKKMDFYDFGRSTFGGGTYNFKKNWGAIPFELCYKKFKLNAANIAMEEINPRDGGKLPLIWARTPHFISNFIGPLLRKRIF